MQPLRTLCSLLLLLGCQFTGQRPAGHRSVALEFQGLEREYTLHAPAPRDGERESKDAPAPLLLVFHGGGGNAKRMQRSSGYDALAERHGFIVAYPNAIKSHWNDGRAGEKFAAQDRTVDDVAFVMALIADIREKHEVDADRIYATGVSNGGIFCQRLGLEHPETFAAIASVIGSLAEPLADGFAPGSPLSVLFMNGTLDPFVPYAGGEVTPDLFPNLPQRRKKKSRGKVIATAKNVELWIEANGIEGVASVTQLPDLDREDGAHIVRHLWSGGEGGSVVVLYEVIGGGHCLPGGEQFLPERTIGRACQDIDGEEVIWEFLSTQTRIGNPQR